MAALEIRGNATACRAAHHILRASGALRVTDAETDAGIVVLALFPSVTEAVGATLDTQDYCSLDPALSLRAALAGPGPGSGRLADEARTLLAEAEPDHILLTAEVVLVAAPAFALNFDLVDRGIWKSCPRGTGTRTYLARRACSKLRHPLSRLDWARRAVHRSDDGGMRGHDVEIMREAWRSHSGREARLTLVCAESAAESCAFVAELALWGDSEGATVLEGRCLRTDPTGFRSLREALGGSAQQKGARDAGLMEALESKLLSIISAAPTILVINDAQWMDASTAMVLDYVLHSDRKGNLMVVLAVVGHVPETVESLVEQLRPRQLHQLRLGSRCGSS